MSKVALVLAVPVTVILGPLVLIETYFGMSAVVDKVTLDAAFMLFLGISGITGICGLWLRGFIQPSGLKSPSLSDAVSSLLFAGAISSLAFGGTVVYAIVDSEEVTSTGVFMLAMVFLGLGAIGLAMTIQNFLSNQSLKRS